MDLASRLEKLFAETAGPSGRPITLQEVVNRMQQRGISTMSVSYLQQLRTGVAGNPRLQHLRALADVFDVPLTDLLTEQETSDTPDVSLLTKREHSIALRVHGLSPQALESIDSIIEMARRNERLDERNHHSQGGS